MSLDDEIRAELTALGEVHRLRVPRVVEGRPGATIRLDGVDVLNLSSNDYLGLAGDRRLAQAATAALDEAGVGAGASRLITGTHRLHVALEHAVGDWMRCDGVRLFNSGYAANTGVLSTLLAPGDAVFSDELNHASIIDGCRLSRAEVFVYPHRDLAALDELLSRRTLHRRRLVVTESLFSMDGDVVDLASLGRLCKRHEAALVVDEAHAIGSRGPEGRGLAADAAVTPDVVIGTFGKALGTYGAFAATTSSIAELLWNRARSLVFSTALPPSLPAATLAAIEIVRGTEGRERRRVLAGHARRLRELVPRLGGELESAIAPLAIGDDHQVMAVTSRLLGQGVFAQGIRPPTVPPGTARLRVSLSAALSSEQLEQTGRVLHNAVRHE